MEYPERTTNHGQVTGKLYHLRLRVECTIFVIYKVFFLRISEEFKVILNLCHELNLPLLSTLLKKNFSHTSIFRSFSFSPL
jgi:hypothetical protein